jgi:hypothetical protein
VYCVKSTLFDRIMKDLKKLMDRLESLEKEIRELNESSKDAATKDYIRESFQNQMGDIHDIMKDFGLTIKAFIAL